VIAVANRLLPHIAQGVPAGSSVRSGPDALNFAGARALVDELRASLAGEGSVGVIVPDDAIEPTLATIRGADIEAASLDDDLDLRVTVVGASAAKGLEFDSVVLLEPSRIVAAEPTRLAGLRRLYVVLTRAVSRLVVLHDEPLPDELSA